MNYTPLEEKIAKLANSVIEDLGFSLHHVKITGDSGALLVQIMAEDKETKNLGVDDAANISRAISAIMDVEDPIDRAYRLEVSSPGIDRLLLDKGDFDEYKGFEVKIETAIAAKNGQKRFRGFLNGIKDNKVLVKTDQGDIEIPYSSLNKAKLVLSDKLIKATANSRR